MEYEIYETDIFSKIYEGLEKKEQEWIDKTKLQLKTNPYVGKPLWFKWFREKKLKDKRLYYLIYDNLGRILITAFGTKKEQQKIIDHAIKNLDRYRRLVESA